MTLRGRIGLALLVFALVTLLVLGGTLWVAIRDLHRDAAQGSLAELTVPYAVRGGQMIPREAFRLRNNDRPLEEFVEAFRGSEAGQRGLAAFAAFVQTAQEEIDEAGISVMLVQDGRVTVRDPETQQVTTSAVDLDIAIPDFSGEVVTGTTETDDLGTVNYAATSIRGQRSDRVPPALVLMRRDDSDQQATADLVRALAFAGLVLVVIGIPLAAGLSRSVTGPLKRLSEATGDVAKGKVPEALPTSGPIEVAQASAAFNAMAAEVGATREAQRQLLADIRHDLRTPLTVIGGFSEALRDGTATGKEAVRAADAISDEAGRLERMLDDLDHLNVPGQAGPPLRLESIDSLEVARSAVERFAAEADGRAQDLRIADGAVRIRLAADRDALDRILGNIIDNALRHAPSPGGHVVVDAQRNGDRAIIAVTDDGPGIPIAALPHVFDRFYRADPSRTSRGSGLGLAIVSDLAEALGGRAFAENVAGNGARVGVVLPVISPTRESPGQA
ncbi:MAG: HAMP domain-containing sensor histidine kinase [Chloroflexota bacterium]|jgi:two-component system sensor histidine kinase BaeS